MKLSTASMSVVGAAIVLAIGAARAPAQSRPKSQKRIPISKEAGGEVARVDTVLRTDTMTVTVTNTVYHTDTLVKTVVRVDSVLLTPPPVPIRLPAGLYFGIAGGSTIPSGSIFVPNSVGYTGQMQLGWQNTKQGFGGRISGSYAGLGEDTQFSRGSNAQLWTYSMDLKANLPLGHFFGLTPRLNAYGIGGWTYSWFRDLPHRLDTPENAPNVYALGDGSWSGKSGWDAGGGLALMFGRSEIFVESRAISFGVHDSPRAYQVPIVFGFNWY